MRQSLGAAGLALALVLMSGGVAEARNARGAFITGYNHMDPTAPHDLKIKNMRFSDSKVRVERCRECGSVRETQTFDNGRVEVRRYYRFRSRRR